MDVKHHVYLVETECVHIKEEWYSKVWKSVCRNRVCWRERRVRVETECVDMKVKSVSGNWVCWHESEKRQSKLSVLTWIWKAPVETECVDIKEERQSKLVDMKLKSVSGNWVCWREEELQVMAWRTQHASDHWQLFPLGYPVRAIDLLSCLHRIRGRRNELKEINKGTNWLAASELEYYTSQMGLENKDVFSRW